MQVLNLLVIVKEMNTTLNGFGCAFWKLSIYSRIDRLVLKPNYLSLDQRPKLKTSLPRNLSWCQGLSVFVNFTKCSHVILTSFDLFRPVLMWFRTSSDHSDQLHHIDCETTNKFHPWNQNNNRLSQSVLLSVHIEHLSELLASSIKFNFKRWVLKFILQDLV